MANLTLVLTVFKHFNTGAFTWPTGVAVNCHIKCELNGCNNGARDNVLVFSDGVVEMGNTHMCL